MKRSIHGCLLDELHRRGAGVEAGDQRQRDQEARDRADQRDPAHRASRCSSRPNASSSDAEEIGSQIARLSKPMFLFFVRSL